MEKKNKTTQIILVLLLGPLGLVYSSAGVGILLTVIAIATIPTGFIPVVCWILAFVIGWQSVEKHNNAVDEILRKTA